MCDAAAAAALQCRLVESTSIAAFAKIRLGQPSEILLSKRPTHDLNVVDTTQTERQGDAEVNNRKLRCVK